ncbi:MAG: hypothetical protein ACTSRQ_12235 [Candidatus Thorarchaeota archaeon]
MGLTSESQIGKKHTVYLPKAVVEEASLEIGMKIPDYHRTSSRSNSTCYAWKEICVNDNRGNGVHQP